MLNNTRIRIKLALVNQKLSLHIFLFYILFFQSILFQGGIVLAFQDNVYTAKNNGEWNDANTWEKNGVDALTGEKPVNGDDVIIKGYTVSVSSEEESGTINISDNGKLEIKNGGSLNVYGNVIIKKGIAPNSAIDVSTGGFIEVFNVPSTLEMIPIASKEIDGELNPRGYIEYLPQNYDNSGETKYPVIYWLHGLGNDGDGSTGQYGLQLLLNSQISNWLKTNDVPFIIFAPQDQPNGGYFGNGRLADFVEWTLQEYGDVINQGSMHLAGLSAGGYGIRQEFINNTNTIKRFSTLTVMSSNWAPAIGSEQNAIDNDFSVWFHHGEKDGAPNAVPSVENFYNKLYALNPNPNAIRMSVYKDVGHFAWEYVYNHNGQVTPQVLSGNRYNWSLLEPDWYEWLLSRSKVTIGLPNYIPVATPIITNVGRAYMPEGSTEGVDFEAQDKSGNHNISFSLNNAPSFASLIENGDGTGGIIYSPQVGDYGDYTFDLVATNTLGMSTTYQVHLTVVQYSDEAENTIDINFCQLNAAAAPWNNTLNSPAQGLSLALDNENGNPSGITMTFLDTWNGGSDNNGTNTGDNSGAFPDDVIKSYYADGRDNLERRIEFSGLDLEKEYNFTFFAGRRDITEERTTNYRIEGNTVSLNVAQNTQNTVSINQVRPDGDGKITVYASKLTGSFFYIGAMVIQINDYNHPPQITAPTEITLDEGSSISQPISAPDPENLGVTLSLENNPSFVTLNDNGDATGEIIANPFYGQPGTYTITLVAEDISGRSSEQEINLIVNSIIAGTNNSVYLNFCKNDPQPGIWNNIEWDGHTSATVYSVLDRTGQNSGISFTIDDFQDGNETLGAPTGDYSGIYYDNVIVSGFSDNTGVAKEMKMSNLESTSLYDITLYANVSGASGLNIDFSLEGAGAIQTQSLDVANNTSQAITFLDVSPNPATNEIKITISENNSTDQIAISVLQIDVRSPKTVQVNFNNNSSSNHSDIGWNNTESSPTAGLTLSNLVDSEGQPTAISLKLLDNWAGGNPGSDTKGATTGDDSGVLPDQVMQSYYGDPSSTATREIELSGLEPNKLYKLSCFASRGNISDTRETKYSVGTDNVILNVTGNTSQLGILENIQADATGKILLEVNKEQGSFFYIGALIIEWEP